MVHLRRHSIYFTLLWGWVFLSANLVHSEEPIDCEDTFKQIAWRSLQASAKKWTQFDEALQDSWARLSQTLSVREKKPFDFDLFIREKNAYADRAAVLNSPPIAGDSVEKWLAYIEKASAISDLDPLRSTEILNGQNRVRKKRLLLAIRPLIEKNADGKLSPLQVKNLIAEVYVNAHDAPTSLKGLASTEAQSLLTQHIVQRFEREVATENVIEAFEHAGLLKEPSQIERFYELFSRYEPTLDRTFSGLFDLGAIAGGLPPPLLPGAHVLTRVKLPPALKEKILKQGINSVYPDLLALYQRSLGSRTFNLAEFDLKWTWFKNVYLTGVGLAFAKVFVDESLEKYKIKKQMDKVMEKIHSISSSAPKSDSELNQNIVENYRQNYLMTHTDEQWRAHERSAEFKAMIELLVSPS